MHRQRNQCVSRLSCTKSRSLLGQFSRGTWCIADAINAFHGFLAPSLSRFRGNSSDELGASPTQSMRFTAFLHQVSADSKTILLMNLVHCQRNQCVSRLSCTKSQPLPSQFFWGTWCITDAINAFHVFLAPSLSRFRANSSGGLGASPTQSMRFPAFLHQISADSEPILPGDLVHHRRNQCVSRLSCTKSQPIPRQKVGTCIQKAIQS